MESMFSVSLEGGKEGLFGEIANHHTKHPIACQNHRFGFILEYLKKVSLQTQNVV